MSRVGKYPILLKDGISINISGNTISVKGAKAESSLQYPDCLAVEKKDNTIEVSPLNESLEARKLWGTFRSLINNMVIGVSEGFEKKLEIKGVGYRAAVKGNDLVLQLGFSHEVVFPIPQDVTVTCKDPVNILIAGTDKQRVGQVAAKIRDFKKPEPYKGKGIKYSDEVILRKEGKKK